MWRLVNMCEGTQLSTTHTQYRPMRWPTYGQESWLPEAENAVEALAIFFYEADSRNTIRIIGDLTLLLFCPWRQLNAVPVADQVQRVGSLGRRGTILIKMFK